MLHIGYNQGCDRGDIDAQLRTNREIHKIIWEITGNQLLQSMVISLFDIIESIHPACPSFRDYTDAIIKGDERASRLVK